MDELLPSLHAAPPVPLPFAPTEAMRGYLLARPAGNLLIYSAPSLATEAQAIAGLGGAGAQYLNHWHEAAFGGGAEVAAALGVPVHVHAADRPHVPADVPVAATFERAASLDGDVEVIPIPGHTPGATAFLWDSGQDRVLFTGDSIMLDGDGEWIAAVLDSSDRAAYVQSLERLRELEFDALAPWAANMRTAPIARTSPPDARRRLDALIARVRDGAAR